MCPKSEVPSRSNPESGRGGSGGWPGVGWGGGGGLMTFLVTTSPNLKPEWAFRKFCESDCGLMMLLVQEHPKKPIRKSSDSESAPYGTVNIRDILINAFPISEDTHFPITNLHFCVSVAALLHFLNQPCPCVASFRMFATFRCSRFRISRVSFRISRFPVSESVVFQFPNQPF